MYQSYALLSLFVIVVTNNQIVYYYFPGEDDLVNIMGYLRVLDKTQLCRLGMVLGLSRLRVKVMMDTPTFLDDMIFSWMQQADNVATESGVPTWRSLVKALKHPLLQENGIASNIVKDKLLE